MRIALISVHSHHLRSIKSAKPKRLRETTKLLPLDPALHRRFIKIIEDVDRELNIIPIPVELQHPVLRRRGDREQEHQWQEEP